MRRNPSTALAAVLIAATLGLACTLEADGDGEESIAADVEVEVEGQAAAGTAPSIDGEANAAGSSVGAAAGDPRRGIFRRIWDRVPRPVKRVSGRAMWALAAVGLAAEFWQSEEDCLRELPGICRNEAARKCDQQKQAGQVFLGLTWPQVDTDGDGTPENFYGTCRHRFSPAHDAWGYQPECATATCNYKCANAGAVGSCDNPCPNENPGLCCEDAGELLCDEEVGCMRIEVACDSPETGDCGIDDTECYES